MKTAKKLKEYIIECAASSFLAADDCTKSYKALLKALEEGEENSIAESITDEDGEHVCVLEPFEYYPISEIVYLIGLEIKGLNKLLEFAENSDLRGYLESLKK